MNTATTTAGHVEPTAPKTPPTAVHTTPRVPGLPFLGNALEMSKDIGRFFLRCYRQYGPVFEISMLGNRFEGMYASAPVDVRQGGTARGLAALLKGECEFAAISDEPTPEQVKAIEAATKKRLFVAPIALDGVCVYVNRGNPIASLTKPCWPIGRTWPTPARW